MARVSARTTLPGRVYEAEEHWYDLHRWPEWVDGLAEVVEVQGDWPKAGAVVTWRSGPAGRGTVREEVLQYEPRSGQAIQIEDESITGRQSVAFIPQGEGFELRLTLDYRLRRRSPVRWLVDVLFIRRLMSQSLAATLHQFQSIMGDSPARAFK